MSKTGIQRGKGIGQEGSEEEHQKGVQQFLRKYAERVKRVKVAYVIQIFEMKGSFHGVIAPYPGLIHDVDLARSPLLFPKFSDEVHCFLCCSGVDHSSSSWLDSLRTQFVSFE